MSGKKQFTVVYSDNLITPTTCAVDNGRDLVFYFHLHFSRINLKSVNGASASNGYSSRINRAN